MHERAASFSVLREWQADSFCSFFYCYLSHQYGDVSGLLKLKQMMFLDSKESYHSQLAAGDAPLPLLASLLKGLALLHPMPEREREREREMRRDETRRDETRRDETRQVEYFQIQTQKTFFNAMKRGLSEFL